MKMLLAAALAVSVFVAPPAARADSTHGEATSVYTDDYQGFVPGADRLEGRILAPCCWNQTLDIHGSDVSNSLRREIRQRLRKGDSPDTIEADLVNRYGERILAVPKHSPLKGLAIALSAGMGLAGAGAVAMLVRWRRRAAQGNSGERKQPAPKDPPRDELDERLDKELEDQD